MPFLLPFIPIITAAVGAAGLADTIYNQVNSGGGSSPTPIAPTGPKPPDAQALLQQKSLIGQQLPNVIGQTSGLANPDYDALIAKILSGVVGQPGAQASGQAATGQAFTPANSQPTNAAVNNQPVNLSDFINSFAG